MALTNVAYVITLVYFGAMPIFALLLIGYSIGFYRLARIIATQKNKTRTSSHRAIEARHPIIIYLYILSILLIILVERPITTYCMIVNECFIFAQYISPVLFAFNVFGYFYIFLVRTWILYFEIQFNLAKKDIIWQKHLYLNYLSPSNKFNKSKQDWFLENRQTFGSPKWLFTKILCIPFALSSIISIAVGVSISYHHTLWWWMTNGVLLSFPVFAILFLWKVINPIHDFYRIRAEMRVTLWLWIIICAFLVAHLIVFNFITVNYKYQNLSDAIKLWEVGICFTLNGLISTAWVYYLTKHKYFEYSPEFVNFEMAKLQRTFEGKSMIQRITTKMIPIPSSTNVLSAASSSEYGMTPSLDHAADLSFNKSEISHSSKNVDAAEKIYSTFPLRDILITDTGFRLFMQHMTSEYSAESLLFLVDIVRYKYAMNGFKHIEYYSDSVLASMMRDADEAEDAALDINDMHGILEWYMPLPEALVDEVVKPPNVDNLKSIEIQINAANANKEKVKSRAFTDGYNIKKKAEDNESDEERKRSTTGSMTTFNPLFHQNANIDSEAKQDGTLNEIKSWDNAQIAWGTLSHALMIYEKYIKFGSLFEINISHRMRHKLKLAFAKLRQLYMVNHDYLVSGTLEDLMSGYAKFNDNIHIFAKYPEKRKELQHVFDEVSTQVESLMNDSYLRFRQTRTYHRLLKQLIKNRRKRSKNDQKVFFSAKQSSKKISMSVK